MFRLLAARYGKFSRQLPPTAGYQANFRPTFHFSTKRSFSSSSFKSSSSSKSSSFGSTASPNWLLIGLGSAGLSGAVYWFRSQQLTEHNDHHQPTPVSPSPGQFNSSPYWYHCLILYVQINAF
jgi:hypothetical protein